MRVSDLVSCRFAKDVAAGKPDELPDGQAKQRVHRELEPVLRRAILAPPVIQTASLLPLAWLRRRRQSRAQRLAFVCCSSSFALLAHRVTQAVDDFGVDPAFGGQNRLRGFGCGSRGREIERKESQGSERASEPSGTGLGLRDRAHNASNQLDAADNETEEVGQAHEAPAVLARVNTALASRGDVSVRGARSRKGGGEGGTGSGKRDGGLTW